MNNEKGFSLLELIVVFAIIALITSVAGVQIFSGMQNREDRHNIEYQVKNMGDILLV